MALREKGAPPQGAKPRETLPPHPSTLAPDREAIPGELKEFPNWVLWRWKWLQGSEGREGRWTKVPYQPSGRKAKSNDPGTWSGFKTVWGAYTDGGFDGIGFTLTDSPFIGVDLDHCFDEDGQLADWAREHVDRLNNYTERSVSGTGLHILMVGEFPVEGKRKGPVEAYSSGQYLTVSGAVFEGHDRIAVPGDTLTRAWFSSTFDAPQEPAATSDAEDAEDADGARAADNAEDAADAADPFVEIDDGDLLRKAQSAKNGAKFNRLWSGDWSGYPSPSEADQALCYLLAYWTNRDAAQVDRLFRQSGLMRPKWDEIHGAATYGAGTIQKALEHPAPRHRTVRSPASPLENARLFIEARFAADGHRTLHFWRGTFYDWANGYRQLEDDELRAKVYAYFGQAEYVDDDKRKPFNPTTRKVGDILDALRALCILPTTREAPFWLGKDNPPFPLEDVLVVANGILHLPTRQLSPHDPRLFVVGGLPVPYDPNAPKPVQWLTFLDSIWGKDEEAKATLQQVFGYLVSGETKQQKIFFLVGPQRSGKGTMIRVLKALLGPDNIVSPRLRDLRSEFGKQALIDKKLAAVTDLRQQGWTNHQGIIEDLLTLSGGDPVTINRKFLPAWNGDPTVRILVASNEIPRLEDDSGAIADRFIILSLSKSFLGKEDTELNEKLKAELAGILQWSLAGLDQLHLYGRFDEPQSAKMKRDELVALTSPIKVFVEDCCLQGPKYEVEKPLLYEAYKNWCDQHGRHPANDSTLGKKLSAAMPELQTVQPRREDGSRPRMWGGIKLRPEVEDATFFKGQVHIPWRRSTPQEDFGTAEVEQGAAQAWNR